MENMQSSNDQVPKQIHMRFGESFLKDYVPKLINDPEVAMVEIVSNSSDAGADFVKISWPHENGGEFSVIDNGTGMTYDEFVHIWSELSYNRANQGKGVTFPEGNRQSKRKIYGKNGKGRLSLFCFDDEYIVETAKDGEECRFRVIRQYERGRSPFVIELISRNQSNLHGTRILCNAAYNYIPTSRLVDLIGSKFIADPALDIEVNGSTIQLTDLSHLGDRDIIEIPPYGSVDLYIFDSQKGGRTSRQHGVAWWVNNKGVGKLGWKGPNGTSFIDARTSEAKRYTFIVMADILEDDVEYDWTGFIETDKTNSVLETVNEHIQTRLDDLFFSKRKDRREVAMKKNRERLKSLTRQSRRRVARFVDEFQTAVPTIQQEYLDAAVGVLANLEEARTGYRLLEQLAELSPADVDSLSKILDSWSVRDAEIVLEELEQRLKLIEKLEQVVDKDSDELHVIHPLIKNGLWIFGPEYESISFTSNQGLTTVIRKLLGDPDLDIDNPRKRPDFVALPDRRIGVFARDSFGDDAEPDGIEKVLIVELKRGESKITKKDIRQAEDYAEAIMKSGNLVPNAKIVCYVLGSTLGDAQKRTLGDDSQITVYPRTYRTIISQAQARTFYLKRKIEATRQHVKDDSDIDTILLIPPNSN